MKNYYHILEVSNSASAAEIKRSFRRLALLYHPDKNPHPSAEQVFKELNEAYDVLGDEQKRRNYDYSLLNQYAEIFQQPQGPMHRDPAYRRRRPAPQPRQRSPSNLELIKEYVHYFSWLNWAGVFIMVVLALDYYSPALETKEKVLKISYVSSRSRGHLVVITDTGRKFRVYNSLASYLGEQQEIFVTYTPILRTVLTVTMLSNGATSYIGGIYNPVFIVPGAMFILSLLGILFRKNIVYHFNLSVGSGILIILVIFLIFIQ